ncbi:transforming acidic coiled-coil-containing protein 3 isoform X2 [Dunckerocampus dactyliophorus]|uniref:transforming acidic coiled-coil-containing protein 3 isoform X2 n=1 Tax=Dunckerocampus dactyliophorus TaxID=161453 RepID=UPI0024067AFC|nr:transforming acidic coiled-coil-containing protein 3 isoform X2 [Dunckerocampus dactyliophorus]
MTSVEVNDENRGICPGGGKHIGTSDDIFTLDQPTGRPSILRQTENLPSKTVPKGIKVCFQTPRRDPVTKRLLSPTKIVKIACVDECTKTMESLNLDLTNTLARDTPQQPDGPKQDDDMPIQSKGGYQLDFDNLDNMDPFQTSNKMVLSPPRPPLENPSSKQADKICEELTKSDTALEETLPFTTSLENSLVSTGVSSTDSSVVIVTLPAAEQESRSTTPDIPAKTSPGAVLNEHSETFVEDAPLPPKGSYNFDPDHIDLVDPFKTGGPKIQNSPVLGRKAPDRQEIKQMEPVDVEVPVQAGVKPIATVAPIPSDSQVAESKPPPIAAPANKGPIKLDFNFDCDEVKQKPPPKKFGKRPPGLKPKETKFDVNAQGGLAEESGAGGDADVGASLFSLDFEMLEDPNLNPFGTKSCINNSLQSNLQTSPLPAQKDETPACANESVSILEVNTKAVPDKAETLPSKVVPPTKQPAETSLSEFNEEFVPGTEFMANNFDGQIDYLEQFGSCSFKESALRKQSLYLKFDPLLRESPKKCGGGPIVPVQGPHPAALVSRFEIPPMAEKEAVSLPRETSKLTDATAPAPQILESLVPPFTQSNSEATIIEVLKYSQKDMDAAIAKVQAEAKEKEEQMCAKYNTLHEEGQEMRKIVAEFELLIAKMMADQEKERELSQAKLNEALLEKEQVSNDLNGMERSLSDLFRRLEKYKEVIDGYKKNEETLKACAQDYLVRIKKEEQRYHTLKAHAEEKIGHANEEIAEVRTKYKAEVSAMQVQLRREQLKVQSLEKNLDQKVKEAEELTKLCDELISNVQKG